MYTRATSIRSNFANASVRHNNHVNQQHQVNNNYYGYLNSNGVGGASAMSKRYSGGDLELRTSSIAAGKCSACTTTHNGNNGGSATRKIVFQPIRTASLKNNHSQNLNGPLLSSNATGNGARAPPYPDDLGDTPLLSRINGMANSDSGGLAGNGHRDVDVARIRDGSSSEVSQSTGNHSCNQSGICLSEDCPGIMFEDVDL